MIWAILLRDLRHETSYKSAFLMQLAGSVYLFFLFLMLSRMFTGLPIQSLRSYGSDYFPYVLTGIAVQQYLYIAMNTFSGQLREAQLMGTFEAVMVTPVPLPVYLTGSLLFSFLINTFHIGVFLVLGVLSGAFSLPWVRIPSVLLVLLLSAGAFSSIGVLSASYCIVFKKGNPVAWMIAVTSALFGGVYFPSALLPAWLQGVPFWIPMTHCLEALRGVLLQSKGPSDIFSSLLVLAAWTLVGLPLAGLAFHWAVQRGRKTGSLGQA